MVRAYVMIDTTIGESERILSAIRELSAVEEAHVVAGAFDVIAEVNGPAVYDVIHATSGEIAAMDGVVDTKTYIALE